METIKSPKIIIYDDENMKYIVGYTGRYDISTDTIDYVIPYDGMIHNTVVGYTFNCDIKVSKMFDNIKLDPTTMKRIAKFNKEQEIRRLDEEINKKKEEIKKLDDILQDKDKRVKKLDDILQDKDKRVEKLKEFVANIYNITLNEDDYEDDDFYY